MTLDQAPIKQTTHTTDGVTKNGSQESDPAMVAAERMFSEIYPAHPGTPEAKAIAKIQAYADSQARGMTTEQLYAAVFKAARSVYGNMDTDIGQNNSAVGIDKDTKTLASKLIHNGKIDPKVAQELIKNLKSDASGDDQAAGQYTLPTDTRARKNDGEDQTNVRQDAQFIAAVKEILRRGLAPDGQRLTDAHGKPLNDDAAAKISALQAALEPAAKDLDFSMADILGSEVHYKANDQVGIRAIEYGLKTGNAHWAELAMRPIARNRNEDIYNETRQYNPNDTANKTAAAGLLHAFGQPLPPEKPSASS